MIWSYNGKNSFTLKSEIEQKVREAINNFGEFGVERIDAEELNSRNIIEVVQSIPFLANGKLVIVNNVVKNNELLENIKNLVDRTPENVDVILIGPVFDKRKSSFKELKKFTKVVEFGQLNEIELANWLVQYAKNIRGEISFGDAKYLVERVGINQQQLANELKKLVTFNRIINRSTIDLLTDKSAQSNIFQLLDAIFSKDKVKTLELYKDQRRQKIDPNYIISMITWQLFNLSKAYFISPRSEEILIKTGMSPFVARNSINQAKKISKDKLQELVGKLVEVDKQVKSNNDPDATLELYLIEATYSQ